MGVKDYVFSAKVVVLLRVTKSSWYPLKPQDIHSIRETVNRRILKELQTSGNPVIQVKEVIWETLKE